MRTPAIEQGDAQRVLQGLDARADGGLSHPQRVGGAPEAAEGADGEEGFDLGNLHSKDSFMSGVALIRSDYTHCERSF